MIFCNFIQHQFLDGCFSNTDTSPTRQRKLQFMTTPQSDIEDILFRHSIDKSLLSPYANTLECLNFGDFSEINWLNTPGPIYTTRTDNNGTGQVEAINNVGGDEDYCEIIFKQPFTEVELRETLNAAASDPFGSYYFDGSKNWNNEKIIAWWENSKERLNYIVIRYKEELSLPEILDRRLYGPSKPIPENYKYWLDFYKDEMKEYLEWFITKISGHKTILAELDFDWTKKEELDKLFKSKHLST